MTTELIRDDERLLAVLMRQFNRSFPRFLALSRSRTPLTPKEATDYEWSRTACTALLNNMAPIVCRMGLDVGLDFTKGEVVIRRNDGSSGKAN